MTLGDLRTDVYADIGLTASPPTAVANQIDRYINKAHRMILREPGMSRLRDTLEPLTFASASGRYIYGLPASLSRIRAVTERDTDRNLEPMTLNELRLVDPGFNATGTPWAYVLHGYRPIKYVPASTGIWAASSSAADTTQVARINGTRTTGLASGDQTATLTGATRVALGSFTDYVDVTSIALSAVGAGLVSFYDAAAAGNTIAEIAIGQTVANYFVIQLYPQPTATITYYVDGTLKIPTLDNAAEAPLIPEEFHDLLAAYARMRWYETTTEQAKAGEAKEEYAIGLSRLKHYVASQPAEIPILGRPHRRRFSRYGSWFPAESW